MYPKLQLNLTYPMIILALTLSAVCRADGPSFDRPGIAFSPTTLAPDSFTWEQGLPDISRDSSGGSRTTLYAANTLVRIGLTHHMEIQLGSALFNHESVETRGAPDEHAQGIGDSSLALKYSVPGMPANVAWGLLGKVTFATGNSAFTADETQYSAGSSTTWNTGDNQALGVYIGVNHQPGQNSYTLSPSFSVALSDTVGAYIEAGITHTDHEDNNDVAGLGFTWMVTPQIQLDASADWGLTRNSNDFTGGIGISMFF